MYNLSISASEIDDAVPNKFNKILNMMIIINCFFKIMYSLFIFQVLKVLPRLLYASKKSF